MPRKIYRTIGFQPLALLFFMGVLHGQIQLTLPAGGTVVRGTYITVPVGLNGGVGTDAFGLKIQYSTSLLRFVGVLRGDLLAGFNQFMAGTPANGQLKIAGISLTPLGGTNGTIAQFVFRVDDAAAAGGSIQLLEPVDFPVPPSLATMNLSPTNPGSLPYIQKVEPSGFVAGRPATAAFVSGLNFTPSGQIMLDGSPVTTEFRSSTLLKATFSAAQFANPRSANVLVHESAGNSNTFGIQIVSTNSFQDVTSDHGFSSYVETFKSKGITVGCSLSPPTYCVDAAVTRGQMAVFLIKSMAVAPDASGTPIYQDVTSGSFLGFIQVASKLGIVFGCSSTLYCPDIALTRAEMAVFVVKALGLPPDTGSSQIFNDVPPSHPYFGYINRFYNLGITAGCSASPPLYCPSDSLTRGQMAVFLTKAFN